MFAPYPAQRLNAHDHYPPPPTPQQNHVWATMGSLAPPPPAHTSHMQLQPQPQLQQHGASNNMQSTLFPTSMYPSMPTTGAVPMSASSSIKAIHPAWLGIVPPTLYRSHPIIFSHLTAVSPPILSPASFASGPSTSMPQTPAASAPVSSADFPPLPTSSAGPIRFGLRQSAGPSQPNGLSKPPGLNLSAASMSGEAPPPAWPDQGRSTSAPGFPRPVETAPVPTRASQPPVLRPAPTQGLDRYASTFVPFSYRAENIPPPASTHTMPPRTMYPDQDYTAAVYPPQHLSGTDFLDAAGDSILTRPPSTERIWPLSLDLPARGKYTDHFTSLLSMSLATDLKAMQDCFIPLTSLELAPTSQKSEISFRMLVPGVREDSPRLAIGDRMILRIMQPGATPTDFLPHPIAVEGEVHGLDKRAGSVYITCPGLGAVLPRYLLEHANLGGFRFQVKFLLASDPTCSMQDAVRRLGFAMDEGHVVARRFLYPTQHDVRLYGLGLGGTPIHEWHDESLNEEQRSAVERVVRQSHTVPYLISGPPGTGKTKTVVEAVQQVLDHHPESSILLCAPSNTAADTLVRRLAKRLTPHKLLRLNSPARTFAEVPDSVMPYCHVNSDTFRMPDFPILMMYRVVVCTCQDAGMLVTGRATNSDMMRVQRDLFSTLYPNRGPHSHPPPPIHPHWTHLFIDEAAQASEPETLIPLEVVLTWTDYSSRGVDGVKDPVVVLCGDVHQLGPVITSRAARDGELDVSLLERLFRHSLYQFPGRDEYSDTNGTQSSRTGSPQTPSLCCTHLVRNYRSIAPILMVPASLFYNDTLIAAAKDVQLFQWPRLPNPRIPILFQGNDTEEWTPDDGASWCNIGEIAHVTRIVRELFTFGPSDLKQHEVAVITPWKEQVWRIRKALRDLGFHGVDVGHVEVYQGAEFRVTILSCVRSRARHLPADRQANAGLYGEPKRFNVAITRAKELLVVVGNANLLKTDPYWNGFLQVMLRNKLYQGPDLDMQITPAYISKIESQMMKDQPMLADDAALMLSGEIARDLLLS